VSTSHSILHSLGWLALALPLCAGGGLLLGPVKGTVQLADGARADDVVVHLYCTSQGIHGGHRADDVTRVVASGEEFLVPWAYRGLTPIGCSLRVYHPRYVIAHRPLGEAFAQQLGPIPLDTWDAFLRRGPTDPPMHASYPWPAMELQQHLHALLHHYIPAFPEGPKRQALARHVPELHALFKRVVATGAFGASPRLNRQTPMDMIRRIEDGVAFPGSQTALFVAVARNDAARAAEILAAGAYADGWDREGKSPLFIAASGGATETVRVLIAGGAEIDLTPHPRWQTPFAGALSRRHWQTAAALIAHGASLEGHGVNRTALESAMCGMSHAGDATALRVFLDAGIAPDLAPAGSVTPLMCAAQGKQLETAKLLIRAGANVNARASHNRTALKIATGNRLGELVEVLKAAGARE